VVPVLLVEELDPRAAFRRAWLLARADYVHALGSLATLAIVVLLTQGMLAFLLRGTGGTALSTAFFLANVVVSPLIFIGSALLYVDQSARISGPGAGHDSGPGLRNVQLGKPDGPG
jgi:hypothetical protein